MSKYLRAIATPIVVAVLALLGAAPLDAQAPPAAAGEAEGGQALSRRAVIRFLTEGDYPPFNYLDEDNVLTGFNVDIARAVCLELAAACDIQVRPWSELVPALRRSEADAIIASHAIGQGLLKVVDVTDRYYHTPGRFAGPRNSGRLNVTASKGCCEFKGGPFSEPKYFGDGVAILVGREDQQLKGLINAALKHIRTTGRYEELLLRYFPLRAF